MEPFVALIRRYVVDYTNRHDTSVCAEIMEPDYVLRMGPHVVAGRDGAYIPAAQAQFRQFPGLGLTVHEIVTNGERLAMRFSEHGASVRHGGAVAVWGGLGLYAWNGTRLTANLVEQDYLARRRQLASNGPDAVESPAPAPWDTTAEPVVPDAERLVRDWIADGLPGEAVRYDDGTAGPKIDDVEVAVDDLFSAGDRVAFRITRRGHYLGGLDELADLALGATAELHMVGLVTVSGGRVTGGRIVRDRLGLARALSRGATR
ncbi:nuclear transport factor 2 family protein [Pseudonocardia nigra]|uniref:nuclear transport factor 2 family protein n=1 Tax=Pseudonocardia nigra TaxID=1921578 RepID=UPI001C5EB138|nr:nuclear transport factor 2 family protein [Pseudonocardia nigra]